MPIGNVPNPWVQEDAPNAPTNAQQGSGGIASDASAAPAATEFLYNPLGQASQAAPIPLKPMEGIEVGPQGEQRRQPDSARMPAERCATGAKPSLPTDNGVAIDSTGIATGKKPSPGDIVARRAIENAARGSQGVASPLMPIDPVVLSQQEMPDAPKIQASDAPSSRAPAAPSNGKAIGNPIARQNEKKADGPAFNTRKRLRQQVAAQETAAQEAFKTPKTIEPTEKTRETAYLAALMASPVETPKSYREAISGGSGYHWRKANEAKLAQLASFSTCRIENLPRG